MRRHRLDMVSLVAGLVFVTFAALFLLDRLDVVDSLDDDAVAGAAAAVLVVAGVIGLASSLRGTARERS